MGEITFFIFFMKNDCIGYMDFLHDSPARRIINTKQKGENMQTMKRDLTTLRIGLMDSAEVQGKKLPGDKKKLETLLLDMLRLLGFDNKLPGDFYVDIQVCNGVEGNDNAKVPARLSLDHMDDPMVLLNFKKKLDQLKEIEERKQEEIDREFIRELNQVIEENFSDPDFNVEQLARKLYVSKATLYRKVKSLMGTSPCDLVRSFRLNRAVQLLESRFGSVLDVALEVGFNNRIYFTKCFKEKFHKTPSQFLEEKATKPGQSQRVFHHE